MLLLKQLGLVLATTLALTASLASPASAETVPLPKNLPESTSTRNWTGASDGTSGPTWRIEGEPLPPVQCEKAPAEGTEEPGKPLGLFHIKFEGCHTTLAGKRTPCTGLGDASEVILALGTWHLVIHTDKPELTAAFLYLPEPTHLTCSIVLTVFTGELACLHLKPTESNKTHLFHCTQSGGAQTESSWTMENGEDLKVGMQASVNGGAPKNMSLELLFAVTYSEAISADI